MAEAAVEEEAEQGSPSRPYSLSNDRRHSRDLEVIEENDYYTYGSQALYRADKIIRTPHQSSITSRGQRKTKYTIVIESHICNKDGTYQTRWGNLRKRTHTFSYTMCE